MKITWLLLRTQIINYLSMNEILQSRNRKKSAVMMGIGMVAMVVFLFTYNVLTAQALVRMGEQDIIPAYMVATSSYAILFLTMLRANGILFGSRDMDLLLSLPIKPSQIVSSKFMFMYLLNFFIGFIFMAPGGIVWMGNAPQDYLLFLLYFVSIFFVPLIPMCIASFIGLLVVLASSRFKNRNLFSLLFSFAALGLIGYIGVSNMKSGIEIENLGAMLATQITGIYPLSKLFLSQTAFSQVAGPFAFIGLSVIVFYCFMKVISVKYSIFDALAKTSSRYIGNRKVKLKQQSPFLALYKKEFGRFLSSYMAVLNTGLGVILLCVSSLLLIVMSPEKLAHYMNVKDMNGFLTNYAPIVIAAMISLSCPAASSLSLEGRNIWILQSSPVSVRKILDSKLAVNLTLHAVAYLLAVFALITRLRLNFLQILGLLFISIAYSIFTSVLGVVLNKKFPNYAWENEMVVVKQSLPVIAANTISMIAVTLPVLLHLILSLPMIQTLWGMAIVLIIASTIMYQKACKLSFI